MRIAGLLSAAIGAAALACGPESPGGFLGRAPERPPIRLLESDARVVGDPGRAPPAAILELDEAALSQWTASREPGVLRVASPVLFPGGLPDAARLRARIRSGGATRLSIVPHAEGDQPEREHVALRGLEIALEPGRDPDAPLDVAVDLFEALHGSFGDAARSGRLSKLELVLSGGDPERAALLHVAIEPRRLLPPGAAAARVVADHGGELRPAWAVAPGAAVELEIALPAGEPELRFVDAALSGGPARIVEIEEAGESTAVARGEAAAGTGPARWRPVRVSLARYAGRRVLVRLRVEAGAATGEEGAGLFGVPVVVSRPDARTPDVLVYLIDTLRADHLGVGGSPVAGVSPTLDRLAREGVWFRRALSSSPWTKPAIPTLMTGILPLTHRVGATSYTDRLPGSVPLLQERFRDAGWRTGSFAANPLGSTLSALERGFDLAVPPRFWRGRARLDASPSADQLSGSLLAWIDEEPDRPFFAYLHTLEVHEWKLPRYRRDLPPGSSPYDAAIRDADRHLGALLEALSERGRALRLVVVSDHGESWGDHGMPSHGFGLYQSQTHVPLIFWSSEGLAGRSVEAPVGLADLAPTLLDGFGLPGLEEADGASLVPWLRGEAPSGRPVLSSLERFVWAPNAPHQQAVTSPDHVSLIRSGSHRAEAFDLVLDPQELHPEPPDPERERVLDELLAAQAERAAAFDRRHGTAAPGPLTPDDAARLEALGYLGGSAPDQ